MVWSFAYFAVRNLFTLVWLLARPRRSKEQNRLYRARCNHNPEANELAVDAPVAPRRILPRQPRHELRDLSECTFIDSSALAILVEANRRLGYPKARVWIVAPASEIRRPFELTGLDRRFAFHPNLSAALNGAGR